MDDKELITYAAKAIGMSDREWNPLKDDGEAFSLAVNLDMEITHRVWCPDGTRSMGSRNGISVDYINYCSNPCASVRRAIVTAAAKIGKLKEF